MASLRPGRRWLGRRPEALSPQVPAAPGQQGENHPLPTLPGFGSRTPGKLPACLCPGAPGMTQTELSSNTSPSASLCLFRKEKTKTKPKPQQTEKQKLRVSSTNSSSAVQAAGPVTSPPCTARGWLAAFITPRCRGRKTFVSRLWTPSPRLPQHGLGAQQASGEIQGLTAPSPEEQMCWGMPHFQPLMGDAPLPATGGEPPGSPLVREARRGLGLRCHTLVS